MLKQYINIKPSTCIKEIFCDYPNNLFYIKFSSNMWQCFGAKNGEDYQNIIKSFAYTSSPGKTFHKLKNSGMLSVNGNIIPQQLLDN